MKLTSEQEKAFEEIGTATKRPNFLKRILSIGKKRTDVLDDAGIDSKEVVVKVEKGAEYPAKCYAYVPDAEKPSEWKLRMCAVGTTKVSREQLGAASAAFSQGGFRGQKVQLPSESVAKVKAKIRSEYKKLGVEADDVPTSVKSGGNVVNELKAKLLEGCKGCAEDVRTKMQAVLDEMEGEKANDVALVRQLAEIVAQIQDKELQTKLNAVISAMQKPTAKPDAKPEKVEKVEAEQEEIVKKKEVAETQVVDVKAIADSVIEELQIDALSKMLQEHDSGLVKILELIEPLAQEIKNVKEQLNELTIKTENVASETKELAKQDEIKVAEKVARQTPFWANRFQASEAAETILDGEEQKKYKRPEMPKWMDAATGLGGK